MTATEIVSTIAEHRDTILAAADEILREFAPKLQANESPSEFNDYSIRRNFTSEQLAVFDTLGWDNRTLRREAGRVMRVVRLQEQAGTEGEREAAKKAAADAAAKLDAEDDSILAEIEKYKAKLAKLQKAADDSAAEVAKQAAAVAHLREAVPKHVQEEYFRTLRDIADEFAKLKAAAASDKERDELESQRKAHVAEAKEILDFYLK